MGLFNPVFLYVANLIGYARALFIGLAVYFAMDYWVFSIVCYLIGQGLDAFDGMAARKFNQVSKFGGVLDMVLDRLGTLCLYFVLGMRCSASWKIFAFLIVLDISSHWFQMYSKLATGKETHKGSRNAALNFYYTFPYVLFILCCGQEFFLCSLYCFTFSQDYLVTLPFFSLEMDIFRLICYITFPLFFVKNIFNVIQLWDSCNEIAELDMMKKLKRKNSKRE